MCIAEDGVWIMAKTLMLSQLFEADQGRRL